MDTTTRTPSDPTLQPLLRERQFWAAVLVGLPALLYAYVQVAHGLVPGGDGFDPVGVTAALGANPVVLYLLARQYARGKAAEAVGVQLAAEAYTTPEPEPAPDELAEAPNAELPQPELERIDAQGEQ